MKMGHMRHGTVVDSNTTVGCYIAKPWGCAPDTRIAGCEILTFHAISRSRLIQATLAEAGGQPMGETMES